MIEIGIGLLALIAGLALSVGALKGVLPLGGFDGVAGLLVLAAGSMLLAHGLFRRLRGRNQANAHFLRSAGLMSATLIAAALIVTIGIAIFGQVTISGFPLGYHVVAEGIPIALFVLFLAFQRWQAAIDRDGASTAENEQEFQHGR